MPTDHMHHLQLPQRLTIDAASSVLAQLQAGAAAGSDALVRLDASAMEDFDTSAVAVLLELRRHLLGSGRDLVVESWPDRLMALVRLYGVDELLKAPAASI